MMYIKIQLIQVIGSSYNSGCNGHLIHLRKYCMGHWYNLEGESCHTVIGKNGKERGTNVTDARKLGLVPSVTTIMDIQAKPALIMWLQNQLIEACINTPFYSALWGKEEYKKYLIGESKRVGKEAADRGNTIHDKLEKWALNGFAKDTGDPEIQQAVDLIHQEFPGYQFYPERSFAHKDGFGGRVDLYGVSVGPKDRVEYVIIDYKTKDKNSDKDMVQYDDHRIQLAAYQVGLQLPKNTRRFNLFISVHPDAIGMCKLIECKQFDRYIDLFYALKEVWQLKNKYNLKEVV